MILSLGIALTYCFTASPLKAQKLDKFTSDLGEKTVMGKKVRIPYTSMINYYGYVKPGSAPDETVGGKKFYYLYVWIPIVAPEIGVRMVSPVTTMKPDKDDFTSAAWADGQADKTSYFDTWIKFERAEIVVLPEQILSKTSTSKWITFAENDDSGDLPANPGGQKYNSLLRITSDPNNPMKSLIRGLYRIGFTTYKVGEVQGSFVAQVGAPVKLPGVFISNDLKALSEMVLKTK